MTKGSSWFSFLSPSPAASINLNMFSLTAWLQLTESVFSQLSKRLKSSQKADDTDSDTGTLVSQTLGGDKTVMMLTVSSGCYVLQESGHSCWALPGAWEGWLDADS